MTERFRGKVTQYLNELRFVNNFASQNENYNGCLDVQERENRSIAILKGFYLGLYLLLVICYAEDLVH